MESSRRSVVPTALEFYTQRLGFRLERGGPDDDNSALSRGDARIMIESATAFYSAGYNEAIKKRIGTASANALYIEAEDVEELHARLAEQGAAIVDPLAPREWGQSEFTVEDPDGNWLTFWKASA